MAPTPGWTTLAEVERCSRDVLAPAQGKRTDDGTRCSFLVVHEVGGKWAFYPHGAAQFGVRLPQAEAHKVAQAILDDCAE